MAKQQSKREPLPPHLPRREVHHEPRGTACACGCQMKRIGQDICEKLVCEPDVFTVERHVRGKWACAHCQRLDQAPAALHIIDKGIPTASLLPQVLGSKFLDHLPLHRRERIFERACMAIARLTLAQWVRDCGARLQPLVASWCQCCVMPVDQNASPPMTAPGVQARPSRMAKFCCSYAGRNMLSPPMGFAYSSIDQFGLPPAWR